MPGDAAYALTRRKGKRGTVTQVIGDPIFDDETGKATPKTRVTKLRWLVREPTKYARFIRGQATQQDVGEATFTMWVPDVEKHLGDRLDGEDHIEFQGKRYEVRTSSIEDETAFVVTADQIIKKNN